MAKMQLRTIINQAQSMGTKSPLVANVKLAEEIYDSLNRAVFNGILTRPKITVKDYTKRRIWGECEGSSKGSRWGKCYVKVIRVSKNWPNLKKLINVMAHEMVHQHEWEYHGVMTHGNTTFFTWDEKLRSKGIVLRIIY